MPIRFDRYRMRDHVTRLGEVYFNGVFRDIDVRIAGLEELRLSWDEAVRTVVDFGLARIDSVMLAPLQALDASVDAGAQKAQEIEALHQTAAAAVQGLAQTVDGLQADTLTDIQAWKAARLAELNAWMAALTVALPGLNHRLDTLETAQTGIVAAIAAVPDEVINAVAADTGLGSLAAGEAAGQLMVVPGYGVYAWDVANTAIADGEICVAPPDGPGRWWLVAPAWDFVWAKLAAHLDDVQAQLDGVNPDTVAAALAAFTLLQGSVTALSGAVAALPPRPLTASASLNFPSIATGASQTLSIAVAGAAVGDHVLITPPSTLPNGVVPVAYVSVAGQVAVRLNNVTTAAIDPAAMTYLVTVFKA